MSAKHQHAEYQRNSKIIRKRVKAQHAAGNAVPCWRCRGPILPGQPFDVGHLPGARGHSMAELAPEHRHRVGACIGNRVDGGRRGAAKTNSRHAPRTVSNKSTTWAL